MPEEQYYEAAQAAWDARNGKNTSEIKMAGRSWRYKIASVEIIRTREGQKQFIADASHELKTPLTTIITNCAVLEYNENETIKSQKEWLSHIKIGVERMSKLVNDLLTLARAEGMKIQMQKSVIRIIMMVAFMVSPLHKKCEGCFLLRGYQEKTIFF